jgi:hypothetical protein
MAIAYLESILEKENQPPVLPVSANKSNLDLSAVLKEQMTPSKKGFNRVANITSSATSPSAASTQTPLGDAPMSVSPCSSKDDYPEKSELHATLQMLAEQYAAAKKAHASDAELATALETVCFAAKSLHPTGEMTWDESEPAARVAAVEKTLREMVKPHLPIVDGEAGSIGSIMHMHYGLASCVGLCRFHVKNKCFDGELCRFCHISRDSHMTDGVMTSRRGQQNSPDDKDDSRRRRKGQRLSPTKTPPKMHAPLAAPLMPMPTPMPMMHPMMQMHMQMQMPAPARMPAKPASKEQAALCELLSSLNVSDEEQAAAQMRDSMAPMMPNPYAYPVPMMPNPYAYGYDASMYGWYEQQAMAMHQHAMHQQAMQVPVVPPVQSLQAQARRKKKF